MDSLKTPVLRQVVWLGNSKRNIQSFPEETQKMMGDELRLIQHGGMPKDAKPFKGVGSGVFELAIRYVTNAYRMVVAVQLGKTIYVLHAFQKKSKQGSKTPQQDVSLIQQRYAEAKELAKNEH